MLNALQAYQFGTSPLRVIQRDGEPWFVASDVCGVLGIRNARDAIADLDEDEKGVANTDTLGGAQDMNIVSESGLYSLVFRSRKPEARAFRKWVTSEVLPAIRRTGSFSLANADYRTIQATARLIAEARHIRGKDAAATVWHSLGLPELPPAVAGEVEEDPLYEPISDMVDGRDEVTVEAMLIGLEMPVQSWDASARRRVGRILRSFHFFPRTIRREGRVLKIFERIGQ
jgi:prophage antirepressor-like protein